MSQTRGAIPSVYQLLPSSLAYTFMNTRPGRLLLPAAHQYFAARPLQPAEAAFSFRLAWDTTEKGKWWVKICCWAQNRSLSLYWSKLGSGLANGMLKLANLARPKLAATETPKVFSITMLAKCKESTALKLVEPVCGGEWVCWQSLSCLLHDPWDGSRQATHGTVWQLRSDMPCSHAVLASWPCWISVIIIS